MPNTTLTADVIAKAALAVLDNEFGWLNKMHRVYEDEYSETVNGYKKGATISIRRPADFTVRTGPVAAAQDVIEGKVPLTIDQQIGVDFKFTSTELTLNVNQLTERVIKPAMVNIVNHVGNDILTQAYRGVYNAVGTPGQAINSFADFARGPERLDDMAVPSSDRYSVMVPNDFWNMVGSQTTLGGSRASDGAYRNGTLGDVGGISTYMTQVMPRHTVGVATGTPLVNGAAQSVTYDTAKNTWTQTLNADGWTASIAGILKAGDVFTIANVFAVNPKTKAVLAHLQQFVVTADVASTGGGVGNPVISPPIIVSGPHQTVSAAPADNAVITVMGTGGQIFNQSLVMHKNAMALAVVPMEKPDGAVNVSRHSHNGISVRLIPTYDGVNDVSNWRLDLLYGSKLIDPRLATRMSGTP